ncbi:MAG: hypothetical protein U9N77_12140 [Thermodesulfobacteriota bacterium]|nr:hypothetical protein [Thermodesulfobacteriota bacterium]
MIRNISHASGVIQVVIALFIMILSSFVPAFAMKTEFTPSCYISEDYTDNYDQTKNNREEEFYTTYGLEFLLSFIEKNKEIYLRYTPLYKDYDKHDENDTIENNVALYGDIELSKRAGINFNLVYDDYNEDNKRQSWESSASLGGDYQLTKYTTSNFLQEYTKSYDRTERTGEWKEHETNSTSAGFFHQFGRNNSMGLNYTYSVDDYDESDVDEYKEHNPSAFLVYWFAPLFGVDTNISYEKTEYDISDDEPETYSGDIRFIKKMTKHFQLYLKYAHTYTKEEIEDHTVYNPSVGFDWSITEDSGVSLGFGYMIQDWEKQDDTDGFFVEADIFKTVDFSRRGSFTVSGSSGYDATSDDAASLGFNIYYQAGFLVSYQLSKKLSTDISGAYLRDEFDQPDVDRVDNTFDFGAGFAWVPLKWLQIDLTYFFTDFATDSADRDDYHENRATLTVSLVPSQPLRIKPGANENREYFENRIFNNR